MKTALQATPTEFMGVTYRSKCEAMFAAYLAMRLEEEASISQFLGRHHGQKVTIPGASGYFLYEPETGIPGWNPDFLLVEICDALQLPVRRTLHWIEYKPSKPTVTYCRRWAEGACRWYDENNRSEKDEDEFSIFYGNPYTYPEKPASHINVFPNLSRDELDSYLRIPNSLEESEHDWLVNAQDYLMSYRFDLAEQAGR